MALTRDPVSELFDAGARKLLERAYAARGQWVGTRLADPAPRHLAWLAAHGINPYARDPVPGGMAKTQWARSYVRALYYQHKWWSGGSGGWRRSKRTVATHAAALEVEVGRRVMAAGVIPAGRAVRIRIHPGGAAARAAVQKMPDSRRIFSDSGSPAGRWANPAARRH